MNKPQLKQFKQTAQSLKPVVIIGTQGLTPAVADEIECALNAHELIKIRINAADNKQRNEIRDTIIAQNDAQLIQQIGHTITIYREFIEPVS